MAEQRMFAKSVVQCDAFMDMPLTAQALFFHLGMEAGKGWRLNSARSVARSVNASPDDLSVLIDRGFLTDEGDGVCRLREV